MMKNLVTGATGFVGSHIAERLVGKGEDVIALVRKTSNTVFLSGKGVKFAYGDINDLDSLKNAMRGIDIVYHSAALADEWISPKEARRVNVEGTRNLLDAAREAKVKRFVFISSLAVLGMRDHHGTPADAPYHKTGDSYIDTKIDSEQLVMDYYRKYGLPVTVVRPGFVFGPRDNKLIPRLSGRLGKKQFMFVGSGKNKINAVYVENLTDAIISAGLSVNAVGQKYNVTNDSGMTLEDLVFKITDIWKFERPKKHIPKFMAYLVCNILTGIARLTKAKEPPYITKTRIKFLSLNLDFDIKKTKDDLGYSPRVSIEEGLRRTKDWMDKNAGRAVRR
ncbi:MAG: NAD-dependent epimerase/dehydratase family protein [Candidatus Omnitrophota bacterium]|nr:NAD-dependent epimerase/dehydratase family protein [Candidatus Omnitrophota bacterium]